MFNLEVLDNYYRKNRRRGHTVAIVNGAKSNRDILVVVAKENLKHYIDLPGEQIISMDNLHEKLLGRKNPVLVDHLALQVMYYEMKAELEKKDEVIDLQRRKLKILEKKSKK